jgi:L-aspartate oxidase
MDRIYTDVLIIGSGLSGLSTALSLAEKNAKVLIVTKESIDVSNSANAQGGIASVVDFGSRFIEKHIKDTISAGAGLKKEMSSRFLSKNGPDA